MELMLALMEFLLLSLDTLLRRASLSSRAGAAGGLSIAHVELPRPSLQADLTVSEAKLNHVGLWDAPLAHFHSETRSVDS